MRSGRFGMRDMSVSDDHRYDRWGQDRKVSEQELAVFGNRHSGTDEGPCPFSDCPVPGRGVGLLCDDDHCRELDR